MLFIIVKKFIPAQQLQQCNAARRKQKICADNDQNDRYKKQRQHLQRIFCRKRNIVSDSDAD